MDACDGFEPSPVPADADLWPGELPFTAWGQHGPGTLDLRVFDQAVWWVDRDGAPHRLVEMSADYLHNVIMFLVDGVDFYHWAAVRSVAVGELIDALAGVPSSEALARAAGAPPLVAIASRDWLEGSPLMRALRSELTRREGNET